MAGYAGTTECKVIYLTLENVALRVSSVWVGNKQVFPPANRQEVHVFTRDTQGYGREDYGAMLGFSVPVPWWATSADVVIIGAGERGRDGTKSFSGGSDGAGGRSGAWVVKTVALNPSPSAMVTIGKGTSTAPAATSVVMHSADGHPAVKVDDGEGTRTANSGSTGGSVTPQTRTEYNQMHTGARGATRNYAGNHPGAGGGGGEGSNLLGSPKSGRDGGDGYVWLRFRSAPALNSGDEVFVLRVGVSSGDAFAPLRAWAVGIGKTISTITEITVEMEVIGPSLQSLFYECLALTSIPELDTSQVTNMFGMFANCRALTSIPDLDTSRVTNVGSMFVGCSALESVTLPGMGSAFTTKQTLDMKATKLSVAAANALMHSLGTPAPGGILQLPSTASGAGTDADIATAKNWTVTFG